MAAVFFIPFLLSLYYVLKGRKDLAFLNVYLPCALLLPSYYIFRIPHMPPESPAHWALVPLGLALLTVSGTRLSLRRMDLWLALYLASFAASEALRETSVKDGFAFYGSMFVQMCFAYVIGRRLIEPGLRLQAAKRIVLLLICLAPAIAMEYRLGLNPWILAADNVFHEPTGSFVGIRGGHARVQACFAHPILAGIFFSFGFLLNSWLADIYKADKEKLGKLFVILERYHVPALLLVVFLLLTGSRGPLIATLIGYSIAQIGRFRNIRVGAAIVVVLLVVGGGVIYRYFEEYTNAVDNGTLSEQQESAIYRRDLVTNYQPFLKEGGWLGWGALSRPEVAGQFSIDNSYMLIQLSQGKLGLYLFLLMAAEAVVSLIRCAFTFRSRESRFLAFTLLGALIGLFTVLYTVYLGEQVVQLCFLLLGWSQSLQDTSEQEVPSGDRELLKYRFKRVFA